MLYTCLLLLLCIIECIAQTTTPPPLEDCTILRLVPLEKLYFSLSVVGAFLAGFFGMMGYCLYRNYKNEIKCEVYSDEKDKLIPSTKRMIFANIDRTC